MRLLFGYTLQGQQMVDTCLKNIKKSHIPIKKCRFFYCDESTKQYLQQKLNNNQLIIQSCGLGYNIDDILNIMRLSKNKPDYYVININYKSRITRYNDFISEIKLFTNSLTNKLCIFSTKFMYPCKLHDIDRIDSRIVFCNGIHKNLLENYIETSKNLEIQYGFANVNSKIILENMNMVESISLNFNGLQNKTLFQQFFLSHFSDYNS